MIRLTSLKILEIEKKKIVFLSGIEPTAWAIPHHIRQPIAQACLEGRGNAPFTNIFLFKKFIFAADFKRGRYKKKFGVKVGERLFQSKFPPFSNLTTSSSS